MKICLIEMGATFFLNLMTRLELALYMKDIEPECRQWRGLKVRLWINVVVRWLKFVVNSHNNYRCRHEKRANQY
jgi:hypothetical protein